MANVKVCLNKMKEQKLDLGQKLASTSNINPLFLKIQPHLPSKFPYLPNPSTLLRKIA